MNGDEKNCKVAVRNYVLPRKEEMKNTKVFFLSAGLLCISRTTGTRGLHVAFGCILEEKNTVRLRRINLFSLFQYRYFIFYELEITYVELYKQHGIQRCRLVN